MCISLLEFLVKTSYQTQITEPGDIECSTPVSFGSGFIVEYKGTNFFVTADHTVHLDDYEKEIEERTGKDYVVSIFNNYSPPDNILSTVVTPLGGFYSMSKFELNKPYEMLNLVDVAVCRMEKKHFQYPFLTPEIKSGAEIIPKGESKFIFNQESFSPPNDNDKYCIFGTIKTKIIDHIRVEREFTLKHDLKYISKNGDFLLFNAPDIITDEEDWKGLSGSPIISETGECVGVVCDVLKNSKSIWVMPIAKVKMLIETIILTEQINS